jgi:hypothetical protein
MKVKRKNRRDLMNYGMGGKMMPKYMGGGKMPPMYEKGGKPDFLDLDKDGDTEELMKNTYAMGGKVDYESAVPPYNTRNVDPLGRRLLNLLTRDMNEMNPKRAAKVRRKAAMQGATPEQFLRNRALMRLMLGGAGGTLVPQMGNRSPMRF